MEAYTDVSMIPEKTETNKKSRRRRRLIRRLVCILLILFLLGGAAWIAVRRLQAEYTVTYQAYSVTTGTISNALSFSGSLEAVSSKTYTAPAAGTVRSLYVTRGQDVQEDGVIASVSLNAGSTVESGSAVAELYADSRMRVECMVPESELDNFQPGDAVNMEFIYIEDGALTATGRVEKVSRVGSESADESEESVYRVQIVPDTTDGLLYGMTAVISRIQTGS